MRKTQLRRATPIEIELQPGKHRVKTDLGNSFGVVAEPEILFLKRQEEFTLEPGDSTEFKDTTGVVDLKAGLDCRYTNSSSVSWSLWRNDISQNMFRN